MNEPFDGDELKNGDDLKTPDDLSAVEALLQQCSPEELLDREERQQDQLPVRDQILYQAGLSAGRRDAHADHWKVATGVVGVFSAVLLAMLIGTWSTSTEQATGWPITVTQQAPLPIETNLNEETFESPTPSPNWNRPPRQTIPATQRRVVYDMDSSEDYVAFLKRRQAESFRSLNSIKKDPS